MSVSYAYGTDLIWQKRSTGTSYYHVDGLVSTRALPDGTGAVTDTYIYDAYGRTIAQVGSMLIPISLPVSNGIIRLDWIICRRDI